MLMGEFPQRSNFFEYFVRGEEMRCATNLDPGAQEDTTHCPGQDHFIDCLVPALYSAACRSSCYLHRNTFICCIGNVFAFRDPADQKAPLGMEKACIEGRIVAVGRKAQKIDVLFGHW